MIFVLFLALLSLSHGFIFRPLSRFNLASLRETTADFKNGMTFEVDGVPHKLMEFLHVKPGKGSAFVRSKIKNLVNGGYVKFIFL